MSTMHAVKLTEPTGAVSLDEVDRPTPGPGEILVRMEASGLCYTDVHLCDDDWAVVNGLVKRDLTLGHEAVGVIEELGPGVTDRAVGDRVAAPFIRSACGACQQCRRGEENHCPNVTILGMTHDGSHADFFLAVSDWVVAVPDGVSPAQAAPLACAGMSVLGGLRRADVGIGTTVGVIGIGGQGHYAVQLAKLMGARVVAMDVAPDKLDLARRLGADEAVAVTDPDALGVLMGMGMDVVLVTAPSHEAHALAVAVTANGGTISLCAVPAGDTPISLALCAFKGLTLLPQAVATRQELVDMLDLAAAGAITTEVAERSLSDAPTAIDALRAGEVVGRVVFVPDET